MQSCVTCERDAQVVSEDASTDCNRMQDSKCGKKTVQHKVKEQGLGSFERSCAQRDRDSGHTCRSITSRIPKHIKVSFHCESSVLGRCEWAAARICLASESFLKVL